MSNENEDDDVTYTVVINAEEQYSIWRADRDVPKGWSEVGKRGPKSECLAHIKEVWTDMRPLSLRKQMQANNLGA
jgi:MbtH protein